MKLAIRKSDVIDVLSKIQGLAGRKSNLAITTNVLVRSMDSEISIVATDLETGFEGFYPAVIEKEGSMALNARKLFEIVRDFPDEDIKLNEIDNHWFEIGNENVEYHIVGMNPEDFPDVPRIEVVDFFEIESSILKSMIEKTLVIGAVDDKRAHIIGIYFEKLAAEETKFIRMVSTDGSRLSTADHIYENEIDLPVEGGVLIPKKGLNEVNKFLESAGTVKIGFKDNHFIVKKEVETIVIRLLEGDFPNYSEIIMKREGNSIPLNRQQFLMMLKRMSILSSDDYKGAIFKFTEDNLTITSTNPDIGESKEEMEIEFNGDPIEAAFNPKFFTDAASAIDEENIVIDIVDEEKPCLIQGLENKSFLSVIMPMRV